jgi:hypothetical protein
MKTHLNTTKRDNDNSKEREDFEHGKTFDLCNHYQAARHLVKTNVEDKEKRPDRLCPMHGECTLDGRIMGKPTYVNKRTLDKLNEAARTADEKKPILADLLSVYLRWPKIEAAAQLLNVCLLEGDLEPNSLIVTSIDNYIGSPPAGCRNGTFARTDVYPVAAAGIV